MLNWKGGQAPQIICIFHIVLVSSSGQLTVLVVGSGRDYGGGGSGYLQYQTVALKK